MMKITLSKELYLLVCKYKINDKKNIIFFSFSILKSKMGEVSNNIPSNKINVGGVAAFGQSLAILHPELSPCGQRYAFDQYGRPAPPDSLDTTSCAGRFDPSERIEVENSLRSYLSPRYYTLPKGIDQGTDTMFGRGITKGRNQLDINKVEVNVGSFLTDDAALENQAVQYQTYAPKSYLHYENHYRRY